MILQTLSRLDHLAIVMILLVTCVGTSILLFSRGYMHGDAKYSVFCSKIILLVIGLSIMASTDNLLIFLLTWGFNNALLTTLIIHKSSWKSSYHSGLIAAKNFSIGFIALAVGFFILYRVSGETAISKILNSNLSNQQVFLASVLILIAAMTQSAIWPFHRWLISSLNAPTPVSAMMHAGLVNGGGFLLARFAPLWIHSPILLNAIFSLGVITVFYGTLWKLMQPDIKKMLACSTVGQMGFMLVQCGLGLFAAAITHLCWHGFFKAYLFLNSPSAYQEKKLPVKGSPSLFTIFLGALGGVFGTSGFILAGGDHFSLYNSTLVLITVAFITSFQISLTMIETFSIKKLLVMIFISSLLGTCYGLNFRLVEHFLSSLKLFNPQPLNLFYIVGMVVLGGSWIYRLYHLHTNHYTSASNWYLKKYVAMINASQPHPATITTCRNDYRY